MELFTKLGFPPDNIPQIDWDLLPEETFGIFESWGGKERIRNASERFYYFFIDTWEDTPTLCLMERGIKFARVLARIDAPTELLEAAISGQGKTQGLDKNYAIDEKLKNWIKQHVINSSDASLVHPMESFIEQEETASGLPAAATPLPETMKTVVLPVPPEVIPEEDVPSMIRGGNFFDSRHNPAGDFANFLVDSGDGLTVTDRVTGIMWQRRGCDITSIRRVQNWVRQANEEKWAGHDDWRLPTMTEILSLLEPEQNSKGLYLHPCFSAAQPFIFLANSREGGGYWFCDFKQGTIFWASGTIPGGFGRLCRTAS
ncbi:MAG: DUF1566 domain-containing protein [Thermodesulfobacteriota bacterium]